MVTEILRPLRGEEIAMEGQNVSVILYPASATQDDVHLLVNEVVADNDATYFQVTSAIIWQALCFDSEVLRANYSNISSCKIMCRIKGDPSTSAVKIDFGYYDSNGQIAVSSDFNVGSSKHDSSDWEDFCVDVNVESVIEAIEASLTSNSLYEPLIFLFGVQISGSGKNLSMSYSQIYVEITYDNGTTETTETIYLKENGAWTSVPCTIYQKQNGAWVESDATVFENGNRYIFQEII